MVVKRGGSLRQGGLRQGRQGALSRRALDALVREQAVQQPYCKACKSGEGHPSWVFTFRRDGRQRCMHVQPRHAEAVRQAIENGRLLEEAILDEGIAFLERLREQE